MPADFDPAPGGRPDRAGRDRRGARALPPDADAVGVLVASDGAVPDEVGHDRAALEAAGFAGKAGQALVLPQADGPPLVVVGVGRAGRRWTPTGSATRPAPSLAPPGSRARLALLVPSLERRSARGWRARSATEGVLLARYRYDVLQTRRRRVGLEALTLVGADGLAADRGIERGQVLAGACALSRDLANCPPAHLTAEAMAAVAERLGAASGLEVEVFDEAALWSSSVAAGCSA